MTETNEIAFPGWHHVGGGCGGCGFGEFPCDDEYRNTETGDRLTVYSTQERHFDMPKAVASIIDLLSLSGVHIQRLLPPED